tara:strand:- start:2346 stop:3179 length:834 start_codon:yes stop_codon:yes gene_type:complete
MKFSCPECETKIEAGPEWFGLDTQCPHCQHPIHIPKPVSSGPQKRHSKPQKTAKKIPVGAVVGIFLVIGVLILVPVTMHYLDNKETPQRPSRTYSDSSAAAKAAAPQNEVVEALPDPEEEGPKVLRDQNSKGYISLGSLKSRLELENHVLLDVCGVYIHEFGDFSTSAVFQKDRKPGHKLVKVSIGLDFSDDPFTIHTKNDTFVLANEKTTEFYPVWGVFDAFGGSVSRGNITGKLTTSGGSKAAPHTKIINLYEIPSNLDPGRLSLWFDPESQNVD